MRQNMKKLFTLLVTAVMLLSLTACGKTKGTDVTGKYNCIAVASDGKNFTAPESENVYVELKKGGKGELFEELSFELTWELDGEEFSGSYKVFGMDAPITGTLKDSVLEIHDGDNVIRYLKEGAKLPDWASVIEDNSVEAAPEEESLAEPLETSDPLLSWWNGDWYGWWFMYGCKGSYEDFEGKFWDCEAHIKIDPETYTGTMEMWDDEQYQNMGGIGMVDVSLSDSGTGSHGTLMSEGGWFEEKTLSHAEWIIDPGLDESDNFLIITGDYDDENGNVYYYKIMMRKWGELWEDIDKESRPWSYEEWYKPMIEDGVTKMSVRFGDPDPSVYEDLETGQTEEEAENAGSAGDNFTVAYGKSNAEATGAMDLETLKACYETLKNDPNHYEYLYEDVRDLMGCDGLAYQIDGKDNAYCWQSGNVIVTVTFKVLEDGNEECCAFFISGL